MPLPLTASCFSKIQMVLPVLYQLTRVVPDKEPLNGCMYVICLQCFDTWLGDRKGIRPVKTEWWGAGMEQSADLHLVQLMPLPLIVSCFSKIQIGFTFLVPAYPGSPGKGPFYGRMYVCILLSNSVTHSNSSEVSGCLQETESMLQLHAASSVLMLTYTLTSPDQHHTPICTVAIMQQYNHLNVT